MSSDEHLAKSTAHEKSVIDAVLHKHREVPGALLPILHDVQDALGFISSGAVAMIANGINISRAEVHGVVSYYSHFRDKPTGRCVVQICRAESCKAMGADALMAHAQTLLSCTPHGTSSNGDFSLEPVFCLGFCANSPAIMINDNPHARVSPPLFDQLIADFQSEVLQQTGVNQ